MIFRKTCLTCMISNFKHIFKKNTCFINNPFSNFNAAVATVADVDETSCSIGCLQQQKLTNKYKTMLLYIRHLVRLLIFCIKIVYKTLARTSSCL